MIDIRKITGFEWDKGNVDKSFEKHGITPNESEEVFIDEDILLQDDVKHSQTEKRFTAIGKTTQDNMLFIAFTVRGTKIRIVSTRRANIKERREYEKKA